MAAAAASPDAKPPRASGSPSGADNGPAVIPADAPRVHYTNVVDIAPDALDNAPSPRSGVATCAMAGVVYAYGGLGQSPAYHNDVFAFMPATATWKRLVPTNDAATANELPRPSFGAAIFPLRDGETLLLYGGQPDHVVPLYTIHSFNVRTQKWTGLSSRGFTADQAARWGHRMLPLPEASRHWFLVAVGQDPTKVVDACIIFGGDGYRCSRNDVVILFRTAESDWTFRTLQPDAPRNELRVPPARRRHTVAWFGEHQEWLVVFGGRNGSAFYQDLWLYSSAVAVGPSPPGTDAGKNVSPWLCLDAPRNQCGALDALERHLVRAIFASPVFDKSGNVDKSNLALHRIIFRLLTERRIARADPRSARRELRVTGEDDDNVKIPTVVPFVPPSAVPAELLNNQAITTTVAPLSPSDIATATTTILAPRRPPVRTGHNGFLCGNNSFFIGTGFSFRLDDNGQIADDVVTHNDLWCFDFRELRWTCVHPDRNVGGDRVDLIPLSRQRAAFPEGWAMPCGDGGGVPATESKSLLTRLMTLSATESCRMWDLRPDHVLLPRLGESDSDDHRSPDDGDDDDAKMQLECPRFHRKGEETEASMLPQTYDRFPDSAVPPSMGPTVMSMGSATPIPGCERSFLLLGGRCHDEPLVDCFVARLTPPRVPLATQCQEFLYGSPAQLARALIQHMDAQAARSLPTFLAGVGIAWAEVEEVVATWRQGAQHSMDDDCVPSAVNQRYELRVAAASASPEAVPVAAAPVHDAVDG